MKLGCCSNGCPIRKAPSSCTRRFMDAYYEKMVYRSALVAKWVDANPAAHPPGFKDAMMNQLLKNGVAGLPYYLKNYAKIVSTVSSSLDEVWMARRAQRML